MPRHTRCLLAAFFAAAAVFFSLFTWGFESAVQSSRIVFGFTPPVYGGEILPFLCDLLFAAAPVFLLFYAAANLFYEPAKKLLFLPFLPPALYAVLRFFFFAGKGALSEAANRVPVWFFLILFPILAVFRAKKETPLFALAPLLFFLTELSLFILSLFLEKNLSPHAFFQANRLFGVFFVSRRLSFSAFGYFSSLALSSLFLFLPDRKIDNEAPF